MAQLNNAVVTGSVFLGTSQNISSEGNIWYDTTTEEFKVSYISGGITYIGVISISPT